MRTLVRISVLFLAELLLSVAAYRSSDGLRPLHELDFPIALRVWIVSVLVLVLASWCFFSVDVVRLFVTRLDGQRARSELANL
jgi:hypothetical protein